MTDSLNRLVDISSEQIVLIGKPSKLPAVEVLSAVSRAVGGLPQCREAHFPQYFIVGNMPEPRQVLVLVVDEDQHQEVFAREAQIRVMECLPGSAPLDLWIMTERDPLLPAVRSASCKLGR